MLRKYFIELRKFIKEIIEIPLGVIPVHDKSKSINEKFCLIINPTFFNVLDSKFIPDNLNFLKVVLNDNVLVSISKL
jgi:hypothetical protein